MSLPLAKSRFHVSTSAVPECLVLPPKVKEYVESRGYNLAVQLSGDQAGMSHARRGFWPLLTSELPQEELDEYLEDIRRHSFRDFPDGSIRFGDLQLHVRAKAEAERLERQAEARWEALNSPETVYEQVDDWNMHFRDAGLGQARIEPTKVGKVTDHVNNDDERAIAEELERRLRGGKE